MTLATPPAFQIHWSLVPPDDAEALVPPGCRLLAIWPAPVNHDACFQAAGVTLFGDNGEDWDRHAEEVLRRVIENLSRFGALKLVSQPLTEDLSWYLRPFRTGQELPLQEQALFPMKCDSLPSFHAQFGESGVALRTGDGHFLLWVNLPDAGPDAFEFVRRVSETWEVLETRLRWATLLPSSTPARL